MSGLLALWRMEYLRLRTLLFWSLLALVCLTGVALRNGGDFYHHQLAQQQQLQQGNAQWVQQNAAKTRRREQALREEGKPIQPDRKIYRNPAYLANQGPTLSVPPLPSQGLSLGELPQLPTAHEVSLLPASLWKPVHNVFHPMALWLGAFDWGVVLAYVFPLCLMVLGFDLLTDERLRGHLPLYATYQWPWPRLLAAKISLRLLLSTFFLAILGLEVLCVAPRLGLPVSGADVAGALLLSAAYSLFWWMLVAVLHVFMRSPAQIAVILGSLWFLWAWLLPAIAAQAIAAQYPVPSRFTYLQRYRETEERVRKAQTDHNASYLDTHPELKSGADNTYALKQLARSEALAQALSPIVQTYERQLEARLQALQWVRFVSPIYAHQWSLQRFWGSDRAFYGAYLEQLETFSARWQSFFLPQIQQGKALETQGFARFPAYTFQAPPMAQRLLQAFSGLWVWLVFWLLALGLIGYRASAHEPTP